MASLDPMCLVGGICVGTLLHTKYIRCVPYGFRDEDILSFPLKVYWSY